MDQQLQHMTITKQDIEIIHKLKGIQQLSHDPDRPVGVIITDANGNVLESGTNRPPEKLGYGISETHAEIRNESSWKYHMLEHAERDAIIKALRHGQTLEGATMYGTLFPCADCARAIVNAGIARLVIPAPGLHPARDHKWQEHYRYAHRIFELAGVHIDSYKPDELDQESTR